MSNQDTLFYSQLFISLTGLVFTGTLTIVYPDRSSVYFPIFTSLIFAWIPTPLGNSATKPKIKDEVISPV